MKTRAVSLLTFAALLLISADAFSATKTWTGNTTWSTGARWNPSPPVAGDDVIIFSGTCTLNVTPPVLNSLTINSGATLTNNAAFIAPLNVTGNVIINGTFTATQAQTNTVLIVGGNLTVTGTLNTTAVTGLATATPTNPTPVVSLTGTGSTCNIYSGGTITTGNNSFNFTGNLTFGASGLTGGTLDFSGALANGAGNNNTTYIEVDGTLSSAAGATTASAFNCGASGDGSIRAHGNLNFTNITYTPGYVRLWILDPVSLTSSGAAFACVRIGSSGLNYYGALTLLDNLHITGIDPTGTTGVFTTVNPTGTPNNAVITADSFNVNGFTVTIDHQGLNAMDNVVNMGVLTPATFTNPGTFSFTAISTLTPAGCVFNTIQIGNVPAALTLAGQLTLTGDWLNLGGTLTAGGNTVIFAPTAASVAQGAGAVNPSASITGNNTFANFTCNTVPGATLYFTGAKTQTVTGAFAIAGTSGNQVSLLSSASGTAWLLNVPGAATATVAWAEVKDSTASGGTAMPITPTNSTNLGGNNANWNFGGGGASITWQGGGVRPNDWNLGTNWVGNIIPGVTDNVTIPPAANNPSLTSNVAVNTLTINANGNLNLATFNLSVTGVLNLQSGGTLQLQGQASQTVTGSPLTLSGTVQYNGPGSYTGLLLGTSYVNLGFTGGGTYTLNAPVSTTGSLAFSGSSTLKLNGNNLTVGTTITAAGTLDASGGGNVTAGGNVDFTGGAFIKGAGSFIFNGTTSLTTAGSIFNNIQIGAGSGGSLTLADPLTVNGTITVAAGGTTTFVVSNRTVNTTANVNLTNLTTFTSTGSTFVFDGISQLTSATKIFNNITVGTATVPGALTLVDNLTLTGNISVGAAANSTFTVTSRNVTVAGNVTLTNLTPANFTSTGSTFIFDGISQLTSATKIFNNVQVGTLTLGGALTLLDNLTLTGTLTFLTGGATTLNVSNQTVTLGTSLDMTNLTTFTSTGSTFVFDGTASLTSATKIFNSIQIGTATVPGALTLVDNLTLTGNISVGAAANSTFTVTSRNVTVAGNVTLTNLVPTNFTSTGSTFVFDGTTTLTSAGDVFNNITVGTAVSASVTLGDNLALTNAAGILTMFRGTLDLNGHTLELGTALNMSSANTAQITIGLGTLDGTTNGRAITLSSAQASITQLTGTLKTPGLTVMAGTYTITGVGIVTLGTGGLSHTGGAISAGGALISSSGNVSILAAASFTSGSSTLTMDTTGTTVQVVTPNALNNLTIGVAATGTVAISTNDLTLQPGGNLDVITGWTFNTNGFNLTVGGGATIAGTLNGSSGKLISVTGDTGCTGTIDLLNGDYTTNNLTLSGSLTASGSETITVNAALTMTGGTLGGLPTTTYTILVKTNWSRTAGTFNIANGTVQFTGTGIIAGPPGVGETFYKLVKGGTGTTTFNSTLTIMYSVFLNAGILADGGSFNLFLGTPANAAMVTWDSQLGGTFNGGSGAVHFTNGEILINGNNTFWNFYADIAADSIGHPVTIYFQQGKTQTISNNFHVLGTSTIAINLESAASLGIVPKGFYNPPPPVDARLTVPGITPPDYTQQWQLNMTGATAAIDWASVQLSWANPIAVTPGPNCTDKGYNRNWFFVIPILASWTVDTDNNGRIDRIRVQVQKGTLLSDIFTGITVQVDGYGTITGAGNFVGFGGTDVFDIKLPEGPQEDSSVTPKWQVVSNTSLYGTIGGALVDHNIGTTVKTYTPGDGARPVITYTVAALGATKAYVHFSELVYGNNTGTAPIANGSLSYSGVPVPVQPVEMTGSGAHAAIVTLPAALLPTDILSATPKTIGAVAGQIWDVPYPNQFVYPSATSPGDPGAYTGHTNLDGNLPPSVLAGPPYSGKAMLAAPAHNISDVGVGFVTPVFALNQNVQRDPARGGIGMVTNFDGTRWLLPQDVLLEARILEPTLTGSSLTLFWDVNPSADVDFNNLWIPKTATTLWPANLAGDRAHGDLVRTGNAQARPPLGLTAAVNGALRDYVIPGSDPEVKDGALLQFMFIISDGTNFLPCAFPADPNNPGNVRPFEYAYHSIIEQRGHVTITNNVIHPANGEVAYLHYVMPKTGKISITVFNLSGDIINVLASGTQSAGEYTTGWDGKNRGGRIVARGIYFVRVVGPGFDEMRKVLVVR